MICYDSHKIILYDISYELRVHEIGVLGWCDETQIETMGTLSDAYESYLTITKSVQLF